MSVLRNNGAGRSLTAGQSSAAPPRPLAFQALPHFRLVDLAAHPNTSSAGSAPDDEQPMPAQGKGFQHQRRHDAGQNVAMAQPDCMMLMALPRMLRRARSR